MRLKEGERERGREERGREKERGGESNSEAVIKHICTYKLKF